MSSNDFSELKFNFNTINPDDHENKINLSLDYLNSLIEKSKNIIDDELAYQCLFYIGKTVKNTKVEIFPKRNSEKIFSHILLELYKVQNKLDFKSFTIDIASPNLNANKNDRRISMLSFLVYIINKVAPKSVNFCINFPKHDGLKAFLLFLSNESFIKNTLDVKMNDFSLSKPTSILDTIVLDIVSLSLCYDENIDKWKELDTIGILLNIAKLKESVEFNAYVSIVNIIDDKQIESLTDVHSILKNLVEFFKKCGDYFKEKRFNRQKRQIIENGEIKDYSVHCVLKNSEFSVSILIILQSLYKLSINDKMRNEIYFNQNLKESLSEVVLKSNDIELKYMLKLVAQLAFNATIANDLKTNEELINFIKSKVSSSSDQDLKLIIDQITWNIYGNKLEQNESKSESKPAQHLMISYNTASRELCLKIKSKLESFGVKVWIDVSDIHGSSLDSMAKAVENSFCVLVCVTEKYRQSINCQAEAQYAFKLNKKIVPCIMESGYENVKGWLGIIMGDKIFINFTKYEFEECIRRLRNELNISTDKTLKVESIEIKSNDLPVNWNESQVKEWFDRNEINEGIKKELLPCNGVILQQLYVMRCDAPEFYFQSLGKGNNADLKSIIMFTFHLKKLFEK